MSLHDPSLARECEAALAWWHLAGVDCDFTDNATTWLSEPAAQPGSAGAAGAAAAAGAVSDPAERPSVRRVTPPALPPVATTPRRDLLGDSPPADLASFRQWWLEAPGLAAGPAFPRIAPRGEAGAALMVLVPQPEEGDRAQLLEGPQGRLLAAILAAMGVGESDVYLASALPCHTPMADLAALAAGGMDAVTAHHIALVSPRRLLVFGMALAPMLSSRTDGPLREINHTAGKVPVLVSEALDALMDMARLKARFWRRWMEWSATQ
jgi:DNA polymerase